MTAETTSQIIATRLDELQDAVRETIVGAVESTIARRAKHWAEPERTRLALDDIEDLISRTALQNAALAGSATLVPTPVGAFAIPAEIALSLKNTVDMVYDIAVAHNKEELVTEEFVVALALSDGSGGMLGLVFNEDDSAILTKPGKAALGMLTTLLAKRLTRHVARLFLGRLVPVIGSASVAWYARSTTLDVGSRARKIFEKPLTVVDDTGALQDFASLELSEDSEERMAAKFMLFVDQVRHSAMPSKAQIEALGAMAQEWTTPDVQFEPLEELLSRKEPVPVNLPLLASTGSFVPLVGDISAFGKLGKGVPREWVHSVGASFGYVPDEVDGLLAEPPVAETGMLR